MIYRPRRLRKNEGIRSMVRETHLQVDNLMMPLFVIDGKAQKDPIRSMPYCFRYSLDLLKSEIKYIQKKGIKSVLLFVKIDDKQKDNTGKAALDKKGLMVKAIQTIKEEAPEINVFTDVALDPYSSHGHDGIVEKGKILNDATVEVLAEMSLIHANAGADFVAPSDMMDGRVGAIRSALAENGFKETGIMAYSAKYASSFYGPFRDALDSKPGFGDKKTYQMDYANKREAFKEAQLDAEEGADILMVKPASHYLDIIQDLKQNSVLPIAAYQVSGEFSMIKAAAAKGWIDEKAVVEETLTCIKRAGADIIATYFATDMADILNKNQG